MILVGRGRVGSVFARGEPAAKVVGRTDAVEGVGPVVVCTGAGAVADVLARGGPRSDYVFVQNGWIAPLFANVRSPSQAVLWFAATQRDGSAEPGGESVFFGPCAEAPVAALLRAGVPARVEDDLERFRHEVCFKLGWISIFGLLGQLTGETVGDLAGRKDVPLLAAEIASTLEVPADLLLLRVRAYAGAIPWFRASLKELEWRNGAVAQAARARGLATPLHDEYLRRVTHGGRPGVDR